MKMTVNIIPVSVMEECKNSSESDTLSKFVCHICGRLYKHKSSFEIHIGIHNGISPYVCEFCGKQFTQKIGLKKHLPIHTKIAQYKCYICTKTFIHEKTYKSHIAHHTGKRNIYCPVCNAGCDTSTQLQRHFRTHTKEKPFPCDICGKYFAQKYNMYAHKRQIHEGFKVRDSSKKISFLKQCLLCDLSYERNKLAEHLSEYHSSI